MASGNANIYLQHRLKDLEMPQGSKRLNLKLQTIPEEKSNDGMINQL